MKQSRFLRDNILDEMLAEVRAISDKMTRREFPPIIFCNSLSALTELYETNKTVLQHLETAIEAMRKKESTEIVIDQIVEAAAHIQLGLVSVHNALKEDINELLEGILNLKKNLGITDDAPADA